MNEKIDIFYPTYLNAQVFKQTLMSCLAQDYKNIHVHIVDNSVADGNHEILELVRRISDPRIEYHANGSNIGAAANYNVLIDMMAATDYSICLAADIGFETSGLSVMMKLLRSNGSSVVFPSSKLISYEKALDDFFENLEDGTIFVVPPELQCDEITQQGIDVTKEYFSNYNINGEYNYFSFFGALVDSSLIRGIGTNYLGFKFHGFEHYLSMRLSALAPKITRTKKLCYKCVFGAPRLGGTVRPENHFTRLEPILASQKFLEDFGALLIHRFGGIADFRRSQIDKSIFFLKNYDGFRDEILDILIKNAP